MKKSYQSLEDNSTNNMKQVIYRNLTSKILYLGFILLFTFSTSLTAQDGDPVKGKSLFNTNCASCHKLDKVMTGPALRNVEVRLADEQGLDREWLNAWIRNSAAMIKAGDAYAVKIYKEYKQVAMTAFPQLSDQDIDQILSRIQLYQLILVKLLHGPELQIMFLLRQVDGGDTSGGISNNVISGGTGTCVVRLCNYNGFSFW